MSLHLLLVKSSMGRVDICNAEGSVTRLGYYWKASETNCLVKIVQIFDNFRAILKSVSFYVKYALARFWTAFRFFCKFLFQNVATLADHI